MSRFRFSIIDKKGVRQKGVFRSSNKEAAIEKLRTEGNIILSVEPLASVNWWVISRPKLSLQEKLFFVTNLATMVKVGITLVEALEIMVSQFTKKRSAKMFAEIVDRIKSGESLANSLRKYSDVFSELFVNMVETGEKSGNLDSVLGYLAEQLEKEYELRKKIISALVYPLVIMSLTLVLAIAIVAFVMPKITKIFDSFDVVLPLPTRVLIGFSDFLTHQTLLAFFLLFVVVSVVLVLSKLTLLKPVWHRLFLNLPIFGRIVVYSNVARFARSLASLLQAGIPIVQALTIVSGMMVNTVYKKIISRAAEKVDQGGKLGECFVDDDKLFPVMVSKLLYIGETTGTLETTTLKVAELYERNVEGITKNLSVLLEPLLLIMMSVMVGGIALSIILPIYQLPNLLGK